MPTETYKETHYETRRSVLIIDRWMTHFIKVGGIGIIAAVMAIFVFIFWQILPLFSEARVSELHTVSTSKERFEALGVDAWGELPFLLKKDGRILFVPADGQKPYEETPSFKGKAHFTAFSYTQEMQEIAYAADGRFALVKVDYAQDYETQKVAADVKAGDFLPLGRSRRPITRIAYSGAGSEKIAAGIQRVGGKFEVPVTVLTEEQTLFGGGETVVTSQAELGPQIEGAPKLLAVHSKAGTLLVATDAGDVFYFQYTPDGWRLAQKFTPFADLAAKDIASMDFLLGAGSVVFTGREGQNRLFSLFIHPAADGAAEERLFAQIKEFEDLSGGAGFFAPSMRNKAFMIGSENMVSLRYGTTGRIRWQSQMDGRILRAVLNDKYDRIFLQEESGTMHILSLDDPHPEAGWRAFFGKIWYESAEKPSYEWQSSSGSQDFEPKLSLIPLIIGTLKGTFYALIFALPIALLAAVYTSQFLNPRLKGIVKPVMEIMASLPSVVLGFLAALWMAPLIEERVPSLVLCVLMALPLALGMGVLWDAIPVRLRGKVPAGYEFLIFAPVLCIALMAAWNLGPVVESLLFVVKDPSTGERIADFRLWWTHTTGLNFEQRNSLVVGFMMGFAVIPIIFTVTEDALSNVPSSLTSASLALGASRWQTAMRVVLPTASAGILSAIMIGVGRAVGETMIVVMATGNTPIMDFNIFSGMRTLSANIAVELPEAPVDGTLYRTLFLGAMALFMMTFVVNTLAEILRQRLREKYKLI